MLYSNFLNDTKSKKNFLLDIKIENIGHEMFFFVRNVCISYQTLFYWINLRIKYTCKAIF